MKPITSSVKQKAEQDDLKEIRFCQQCLMPDTRPRISFDEEGVCNACRHAADKRQIPWEQRKKEFLKLLETYRSKKGEWDCIVPWSGGKDSSSIAYKLKFEFGMNPLLVTFSPMIPNEIGSQNREALIRVGFDHIFFRPDQKIHRKLARRFFIERGNPKVAWDAGVNAVPVKIAVQSNIPLIFYAEHGESEYGGKVLTEESKKVRDFTEVIEHQIGDDPRNWVDNQIELKDLNPYIYPELEDLSQRNIRAYYFSYFFKWSMYENYQYIKSKYHFETHPAQRTVGTFTDFDSLDDKMDNLYYYMQYIKFGFGRTVRDASRFIQNGQLARPEGLELAKKYDGEFPEEHMEEVLEYLELSREELMKIIDQHRNPEIWKKTGDGWQLRHSLK